MKIHRKWMKESAKNWNFDLESEMVVKYMEGKVVIGTS